MNRAEEEKNGSESKGSIVSVAVLGHFLPHDVYFLPLCVCDPGGLAA
jgi:hypothetical protein